MKTQKGYPKSVDVSKKRELSGRGSNRIYEISKDEAVAISKEFKFPTDFQESYEETEHDFYYLNYGHGKFHAVFFLPKKK